MSTTRFLIISLLVCLAGCASPDIQKYANTQPKLDIREYLNGNLEAWGTFVGLDGMADPRFYVSIKAGWQCNDGVLNEHFTYTDGHTQQRIWHLHMIDEHHFTATAGDVIGTGYGEQYGNAVHMHYTLRLTTTGGKTHDVTMNDWLYLIDDTHLMNHTVMSKFGVKVGELFIAFRKLPE
jgi:hypothetical protein